MIECRAFPHISRILPCTYLRQGQQLVQRVEELVAHGTARTAILQLHRIILLALVGPVPEQLGIDVDFGHVVHNHAHAQPLLILQNVLEQRRLARAQEARDEGDGHAGVPNRAVGGDVCEGGRGRSGGGVRAGAP